jgi:hypothetical protein
LVTIRNPAFTEPKGLVMNRTNIFIGTILFLATLSWQSCTKDDNSTDPLPTPYTLSYGDSILYLKASVGDYIVKPVQSAAGTYTGFPDGIEIDDKTGAINVSKSETGLRYRITHTATDGSVTSTMVVLSGITFTDHYFRLSTGDSMAMPVYNANTSRVLPVSGSSFDEGNVANTGGCSVKTNNGQINLAQTVRNGIFGSTPRNDVRKDFDIEYRLNDASGKSLNKLRVRLYYYDSMADVPADLLATLQDRQSEGVFLRGGTAPTTDGIIGTDAVAKPRPPCVIIIAN